MKKNQSRVRELRIRCGQEVTFQKRPELNEGLSLAGSRGERSRPESAVLSVGEEQESWQSREAQEEASAPGAAKGSLGWDCGCHPRCDGKSRRVASRGRHGLIYCLEGQAGSCVKLVYWGDG